MGIKIFVVVVVVVAVVCVVLMFFCCFDIVFIGCLDFPASDMPGNKSPCG